MEITLMEILQSIAVGVVSGLIGLALGLFIQEKIRKMKGKQ